MGTTTSRDSLTWKEIGITEEPVVENRDSKAKSPLKTPVPHNYEAIMKHLPSEVESNITADKLQDKLYAGVYLNKKKEKYWVERKSNKNGFMLFARSLLITWSENDNYWMWRSVKEIPRCSGGRRRLGGCRTAGAVGGPCGVGWVSQQIYSSSDVLVEVAELLDVCWLEVHGRFDVSRLSPGTTYEVAFVIMLKDPSYGWEVPVNFRLTLPDGSKQEHKECLVEKQRARWIEILAGEFTTSTRNCNGEIEFSMYEYGGHWKKGLVVKGVVVRPKN